MEQNMNGLSLNEILNDLNEATQSKTAEATSTVTETKKVAAESDLLEALQRAETSVQSTKTASTSSPVSDLEKMASNLASADHEALVKEAEFYGAAVADGFMARINQYEQATDSMDKVASNDGVAVEKIAEEAVRGYIETRDHMEKEASAHFDQGYSDTIGQIEKVAAACFEKAVADTDLVLQNV
jgi:hypothetical protein